MSRLSNVIVGCSFSVLLVAWPCRLVAQACDDSKLLDASKHESPSSQIRGQVYQDELEKQLALGCIRENDDSDVNRTIREMLSEAASPDVSPARRISILRDSFSYLSDRAQHESKKNTIDAPKWQAIRLKATESARTLQDLLESSNLSSADVNAALATPDWDIGKSFESPLVGSLTGDVADLCEGMTRCVTYIERKLIAEVIGAARSVAYVAAIPNAIQHLHDSKLSNRKWESYFRTAHFQWWWEVWLNGRTIDCDQHDEQVGRQGFWNVPNSQIIALHPGIGLNWSPSAEDQSSMLTSFYVDMFGTNRWNWLNSGEIGRARGISVLAAYTDLQDTDNWGYGLMYHHNNSLSVAVIDTQGEIGVIVSADLAKFFFERKESIKNI